MKVSAMEQNALPNAERAIVELRGVGKRYGKHQALSRVDLILFPGEVVGFIGPNGAGKTTLIKLLSGLSKVTEGEIEILGENLTKKALTPDGIGLVQESPSFIPYLSGKKNLRLLADIRGVATGEDIHEVLRVVGLDPDDHRPVKSYSLGMRQRLGLAQALMERPRLLLLDEPTNGLDPKGIIELRSLIRRLAEEGVTIFMASHLLTEVEQVCDRVLLVRGGRVIREIDQRRSEKPVLRLGVSSESDLELLSEWVRNTGASLTPSESSSLSIDLIVEKPTPNVIRELVEIGVNIEEVAKRRRSLEHEFMELVGEQP
jgi:ABC-2 type transport system ATP-binding protein